MATKSPLFCILMLLQLLNVLNTTNGSHPLKVLGLFPHPGVSHFHFFHPIMRALAEDGHEVHVVSYFPDKNPPPRYKDFSLIGENFTNSLDLNILERRSFYTHFFEFFLLQNWGREACNYTLRSDALSQILRQRTPYNVIIVEQFNTDCMMGVAHQLKAPVIALSSCALMPWHYDRLGIPAVLSHMPASWLQKSEEMNFIERLANWITFHGMNFLYNFYTVPETDALIQYKFGHNMPSVRELVKNTSLFFVNQHFSLSGVKPLPPSVIELGGIHIQNAKPLDVELQKFLDSAEHGVIFISWGSIVRASTMPPAKRDGFIRAMGRLQQRVIWKWENDTIDNKPSNMYISKWLPQRDILCHPNVKVFMTHAGLMGSSEAAYCGVPVIATPLYGDQFLNAAAMQYRGMGIIMRYEDISENVVIKAVKKVLDKRFMDNAKAVSESFKIRPQTTIETALWWVKYVARNPGTPLLKSAAVTMPRFAYHSLDIYLLLAVIFLVSVLGWIQLLRMICARRPKIDKVKQQ